MKRWAPYLLGVAVLATIAAFTVLSKKWWARKVFRKYVLNGDPSLNEALLENTPLSQFVDMYFNGTGEKWGFRLRGRNEGPVDMTEQVSDGTG